MNETILPIQPINLEPIQNLIQKLDKSIKKRDYQQIVHDASAAITQTLHSQLLVLLDVKSQAQCMLGSYNEACKDAQYMVEFAPTLAAGYIRLCNLHSKYGYQNRAIDVCDTGIHSAASDIIQQIEQLEKTKKVATAKNEKRVDFIAELPVEVASVIFSKLDQYDKVSSLTTSKTWRSRLLDCSSAWRTLSILENEEVIPLMDVAEEIGPHIRSLNVWADYDPVVKLCFDRMEQGCFKHVNSLRMAADGDVFLQTFAAIPSRFWKTASALRTVEFDLTNSESEITVANILGSCPTVTDLSYSITTLEKLRFGDFSTMEPHTSLTSLKLNANRITGEIIEPLLQQCPQIKRLIASECQPTVLDAVHKHCLNMQVLAYNSVSQVDQYLPTDDDKSGIRVLYANDHGKGRVPYTSLMPLLYKNMNSLENVFVYLPAMSNNNRRYVKLNFSDFKLPKVERLSFWPLHGIQPLMLQAIQDTATLRHLSVASINDLDDFMTTLMTLRPVETLRIAHIHTQSHQEQFIKLFQRYAALAKSGPSLTSPTIRHCNEITDQVLLSMAKIETLRNIAFVHLCNITRDGLNAFFKDLQGKPVSLRLGEMDFIYDNAVIELANLDSLESIHLESLQNITDRGIQGLIDRSNGNLTELIIKECPLISENCIEYAKGQMEVIFTR